MTKFLLSIVAFLACAAHGQVKEGKLLPSLRQKLIREEFAALFNPETNNNLGTYASLDIKDAEANFTGFIVPQESAWAVGIKASGAISEGIVPVFSGSKLNAKVGLDVQVNKLFTKKLKILYEGYSYIKYENEIARIENEYNLKRIEVASGQKKVLTSLELEKARAKLAKLDKQVYSLSGFSRDSLAIEIAKIRQTIRNKESDLKNVDEQAEITAIDLWKKDAIEKAEKQITFLGFKMRWWTFGIGINNNTFYRFDTLAVFQKQINKTAFASYKLNAHYTIFNKTPRRFRTYYLSFGARAARVDNFLSLEKVEVSEVKNYNSVPGRRSTTAKYTAFLGDYQKNLDALSFNSELYWFLFKNDVSAVHFYPEYSLIENYKPALNLGIGFVFAFKNKEKTANIINMELYSNLLDIGNKNQAEDKLFKRSDYGLRFVFPINFKN